MSKILVENKDIVTPGQVLAEGMDYLPAGGAFRENDKIVASQMGLANVDGRLIKVIALSGKYAPKKGDTVIAKVVDINVYGWRFEINCAYQAFLSMKEATQEFITKGADLTKFYDYGDIVATNILSVSATKTVDLSMRGPGLRKLIGGRIIEVAPSKVPRIIGKQGSMITMIKEATGCKIVVGQNGLIWISGDNAEAELRATEVILKIERESHNEGLTDKIKQLLESETEKKNSKDKEAKK